MKFLLVATLVLALAHVCLAQADWVMGTVYGSKTCNDTAYAAVSVIANVCYKKNGMYYKTGCNNGATSIEQWACADAGCTCPSTVVQLSTGTNAGCANGVQYGGFRGDTGCVTQPSNTGPTTVFFAQTDTVCKYPLVATVTYTGCNSAGGFSTQTSCNSTGIYFTTYQGFGCFGSVISTQRQSLGGCTAGQGGYISTVCGWSSASTAAVSAFVVLIGFVASMML
jgi:hypothetical protein